MDRQTSDFQQDVVEKIATISANYIQLNMEMDRRFNELCEKIDGHNITLTNKIDQNNEDLSDKITATNSLLTGGKHPEDGIILQLDRLKEKEKSRSLYVKTAVLAAITAVATSLWGLF